MFGYNNLFTLAIPLSHDPAADDDVVVFVAPQPLVITSASWTQSNAVAANTANYFNVALLNGGTAGTAVTAIGGTIGGTAGFSAVTPVPFTISNGTVTAGQVVYVRYNEEGTGTYGHAVLTVNYRLGNG
jgi:hypothetical protein